MELLNLFQLFMLKLHKYKCAGMYKYTTMRQVSLPESRGLKEELDQLVCLRESEQASWLSGDSKLGLLAVNCMLSSGLLDHRFRNSQCFSSINKYLLSLHVYGLF